MPVRPPSSARPSTSASEPRPTTSGGAFARYPHSLDEEEFDDDDDESEDDDVFAFLPPTTAEQQSEQAHADAVDAAARGAAAHHHQQDGGIQNGQGTSPYAAGGAGTAAAAAAALQAQYYSQQQQQLPPHLQQHPFSPFSHSPFANAPPADPGSTSTLEIVRGTTTTSELSSVEDFDPWVRPGTSYGASHQAGPSNLQLMANNPYSPAAAAGGSEADDHAYATTTIPAAVNPVSLPANDKPDQYPAYVRPGTALHPPQSPPSPSTDSHPSTGAGMSNAGHRGDMYKLRRLTSTISVGAANAAPGGVAVEGGRRMVQSDDDDEEEEYEVVGADAEEQMRRKEVRVNLPGTQPKRSQSRSSHARHAAAAANPPSTKADENDDDDDATSDTAGSEKDRARAAMDGHASATADSDAPDGHVKKSGKRRKRSGKHRSKSSTSTAGAYAGDAVAAEAGVDVAISTLGYKGAISSGVQVHSRTHGERRRNPNAQPYYGYAALANANGYDYGTRGSTRPTTRGTTTPSHRPGTAHTTNTGITRQPSTSGSFVASGKRRLGKGDEIEDEYDDGEDGDSMSMSGMSGSIRDDDSREGSIKWVVCSFSFFSPFSSVPLSFSSCYFRFFFLFVSVLFAFFRFSSAAFQGPRISDRPTTICAGKSLT
ncbi:hypothetical protein BDN70DRAFT_79849 [Pholiota conissans]|uniref:Uncharacterized protein n=1 Tax=Pholiota conissans TaxID=109636 RepID=A0A9P6CSZ5_9AGAR|nr:hypothetical protein BDN70DRAFT_79849 [Pholiota conissans]